MILPQWIIGNIVFHGLLALLLLFAAPLGYNGLSMPTTIQVIVFSAVVVYFTKRLIQRL